MSRIRAIVSMNIGRAESGTSYLTRTRSCRSACTDDTTISGPLHPGTAERSTPCRSLSGKDQAELRGRGVTFFGEERQKAQQPHDAGREPERPQHELDRLRRMTHEPDAAPCCRQPSLVSSLDDDWGRHSSQHADEEQR